MHSVAVIILLTLVAKAPARDILQNDTDAHSFLDDLVDKLAGKLFGRALMTVMTGNSHGVPYTRQFFPSSPIISRPLSPFPHPSFTSHLSSLAGQLKYQRKSLVPGHSNIFREESSNEHEKPLNALARKTWGGLSTEDEENELTGENWRKAKLASLKMAPRLAYLADRVFSFIAKKLIQQPRLGGDKSMLSMRKNLQMSSASSEVKIPISSYEQQWQVLPDVWETLSTTIPNRIMLVDPVHGDRVDLSFSQVNSLITQAAAAYQQLGIETGDCVSVFSENSHRWFVSEQGVMKAGGCNAVRGALAPVKELQHIYKNSESKGVVIENPKLLQKIYEAGGLSSDKHKAPKFIVVLFPRKMSSAELTQMIDSPTGTKVMTYEDFMALSSSDQYSAVSADKKRPATIVYTSGTTSMPKGVVLTHENLLYQVFKISLNNNMNNKYNPWVGDVLLSILPCWHIFERSVEYMMLARGAQMVYSSLANFRSDLTLWKPHFIVAVPRLIEIIHKGVEKKIAEMSPALQKLVAFFTFASKLYVMCQSVWKNELLRKNKPHPLERLLYLVFSVLLWPLHKIGDALVWRKIRGNLGGRIKNMISGGSSLPVRIESFFDMIGINIIVGYGLTETSPVICVRLVEHNVLGTTGCPPEDTELKIVDAETRKEVPAGEVGVILARGPGIMKEYKNNPEATAAAIDKDGFFNTGDLGSFNPSTGDLIITGREKDTIVLSNGENVEPQPIEDALKEKHPLIDQVMLVGQDRSFLGAVVVASVSELVKQGFIDSTKGKELEEVLGPTPQSTGPAGDVDILRKEAEVLRNDPKFKKAMTTDIRKISGEFKKWEHVNVAHVVLEPFSVANGQVTMTLKIKRPTVARHYADEIDALYTQPLLKR